jgi:hypothetical protein
MKHKRTNRRRETDWGGLFTFQQSTSYKISRLNRRTDHIPSEKSFHRLRAVKDD